MIKPSSGYFLFYILNTFPSTFIYRAFLHINKNIILECFLCHMVVYHLSEYENYYIFGQ